MVILFYICNRRDLSRTVTLLELIKRREKTKREHLHLSIEIFEKRYQSRDFSGHLLTEYTSNAVKATRYTRLIAFFFLLEI